jgi:predicted MFS family arabinose efflux permease
MSAIDGIDSSATRGATISGPLTLLFAIAVGVIVTNLFAAQTLVGPIGAALGLRPSAAALLPTANLLGYALGLLLIVPLADLVENRGLIVRMLACAALASGASVLAPGQAALIALFFVLGVACSAIQILVPIAASMAAPDRRGRVIGDVMSGLMAGILLSRPLASFAADALGWRAFYGISAVAMASLTAVLAFNLPRRRPIARLAYPALIASLGHLLRAEPALRLRAGTAALVMAAFSAFWTTVALRLAQPPFDLDQRGIALFALAGAGGAIITPWAGRAGDRGWTRPVTILAHLAVVVAMVLSAWAGSAIPGTRTTALGLMAASAVLLDIGVVCDQTLGRRVVNLLQPEARARLNGLFVGLFFLGGALGSTCAGLAWARGGWPATCAVAAVFGGIALIVHLLARGPARSA